jgi:hypothetical protein
VTKIYFLLIEVKMASNSPHSLNSNSTSSIDNQPNSTTISNQH